MASAQLAEEHWRKNGQWFSLTRPLAELVVADQDLAAAFKRCGPVGCSSGAAHAADASPLMYSCSPTSFEAQFEVTTWLLCAFSGQWATTLLTGEKFLFDTLQLMSCS